LGQAPSPRRGELAPSWEEGGPGIYDGPGVYDERMAEQEEEVIEESGQ